jgi:hypothetical protein
VNRPEEFELTGEGAAPVEDPQPEELETWQRTLDELSGVRHV